MVSAVLLFLWSLTVLFSPVAAQVKFSWLDSGAPSSRDYTTIFAIHGMGYTSPIFKRVQSISKAANIRFVAINRRGYPGSTPFSEAESNVLLNGTSEAKAEFLAARGVELGEFIDSFITLNNIPAISGNGKSGGIALLGWSSGTGLVLSTVASANKLSADAQSRLASRLRSVIMFEPPSIILGQALPEGTWSPHLDPSIPVRLIPDMYTQWITSYFDHGDLSTRDTGVLSYIVPSFARAPSIYNMSAQDRSEMIKSDVDELPSYFSSMAQSNDIYKRALFDKQVRELLPRMKVWELSGDKSCSFSLAAYWDTQDDNEAAGGGFVNFKMIPGVNHFFHWDEPVKFLLTLRSVLA